MSILKKFPKTYNPADCEDEIYQKWENSGYFNPDNLDLPENAPTYTIILPPPNITDKLHIGHSSMLAIEDLLIRYHRMKGFRTLWLPGTDHAAIATQNAVEKKLFQEEGKTRHDLGKSNFLKKVWNFLGETQAVIQNQIRKIGSSLDWSREAFTLDAKRKKSVERMFIEMYQAGAIYRGERIVNWCPRCHSTLADDEVEHQEENAKLYWIKYGPFVLATTRPETKLGDTAVAVHPDDSRYKNMVGKDYEIEGVLGKFKIKVVADKSVDPKFGSGAIKVTPSHSFIDNEIAQRHSLPMKKIIDEDGKMMENCGKYAGLTTKQARDAIVADMEKMSLIEKIDENYIHNNATCYRCGSIIEPIPSMQWFVDVNKPLEELDGKSLKVASIDVIKNKKIEFIPNRFEKKYFHWMENLHDWCISRQIWFGHKIPAFYKEDAVYVGEKKPKEKGWKQDPDSLDTWFSSGMWTFSTLGWPGNYKKNKKSGDLEKFHPTQVLETGYDILTLWVSRMIMMSLFAVGEIPFEKVYLHGLVLDRNGKKMSKSKGNGIDPLDMIEKYGTDALRLSLLTGSTPGNDVRIYEEKIANQRNLVNKIWNISRYIITNGEENDEEKTLYPLKMTLADKWILAKMNTLIGEIEKNLKKHNFSVAGEKLRDFTWNDFADWYLEVSKIEKNKEEKNAILKIILKDLLKLWHPFIPFVTERIWQEMKEKKLLLVERYPQKEFYEKIISSQNKKWQEFEIIKKIILTIRSARSQYKIPTNKKIKVIVFSEKFHQLISKEKSLLENLKTGAEKIEVCSKGEKITDAFYETFLGVEIYIPLEKIIDAKKEKERLEKELALFENLLKKTTENLSSEKFISNAPEKIIQKEKDRSFFQENKIAEIKKQLENLN